MSNFTEKGEFKSAADEPKPQPVKKQIINLLSNGSRDPAVIAIVLISIPVLFGVIKLVNEILMDNYLCTGFFVIADIFLVFLIINSVLSAQQEAKLEAEFDQLKEKYYAIKNTVDIPETAKEINYFKSDTIAQNKTFICKENDNILLFPSSPFNLTSLSIGEMIITTIPINDIEYFSKNGGLVRMNYLNNKNEKCSLFFDINAAHIFDELIPEKESNFVPEYAKKINYLKSAPNSSNSPIKL